MTTKTDDSNPTRWHNYFLYTTAALLLEVFGASFLIEDTSGSLFGVFVLVLGVTMLIQALLYLKLFHSYYVDAKQLKEKDAPYQPKWGWWVLFHALWSPITAIVYIMRRDKRLREG